MTQAMEHYQEGELGNALAAVAAELRRAPSDSGKRAFYAELLCLNGEFEKADSQLVTLQALNPDALMTVGTWRRLLQAAQARADVFSSGRAPDLLADADEQVGTRLDMLLAVREENWAQAAGLAAQLEERRQPYQALIDGKPVDDARDLDDLTAGMLEVLAGNGRYYWVAMSQLETLVLHRPQRPLDLLWRPADLVLTSGTSGQVFIPMIYPTLDGNEQALLGRATYWQERAGLVRGIGLRTWLAGDEALPLGRIHRLQQTTEGAFARA